MIDFHGLAAEDDERIHSWRSLFFTDRNREPRQYEEDVMIKPLVASHYSFLTLLARISRQHPLEQQYFGKRFLRLKDTIALQALKQTPATILSPELR